VARGEVFYSPKRPDTAILATVEFVAKSPFQQRMIQGDVSWSQNDVRALPSHRARLPNEQWCENPA